MTMTAIRINNVIINATSRAQARDMAKESGGKIVDRGTFAAKRWGVKVDRIHCADFGTIPAITRRTKKFLENVKSTVKSGDKNITVMTAKGAKQWAIINRVKAA